ncbi:hypothetical protein E2C01_062111 [Portunus trituberculatus]|uniref:Uncharacterized protein n=1 Tax=Portunus trituberculatus TaxID=210409 RepID=A0A5B7HE83_PORTR|nr:hypothetical protein [Portunus trituberculatus]
MEMYQRERRGHDVEKLKWGRKLEERQEAAIKIEFHVIKSWILNRFVLSSLLTLEGSIQRKML